MKHKFFYLYWDLPRRKRCFLCWLPFQTSITRCWESYISVTIGYRPRYIRVSSPPRSTEILDCAVAEVKQGCKKQISDRFRYDLRFTVTCAIAHDRSPIVGGCKFQNTSTFTTTTYIRCDRGSAWCAEESDKRRLFDTSPPPTSNSNCREESEEAQESWSKGWHRCDIRRLMSTSHSNHTDRHIACDDTALHSIETQLKYLHRLFYAVSAAAVFCLVLD